MKFVLLLTIALTSFSSFALEITGGAALMVTTLDYTGQHENEHHRKEARVLLQDSSEFMKTGIASVFLEKKINDKISEDGSLSEDEALDEIIQDAQDVLAK